MEDLASVLPANSNFDGLSNWTGQLLCQMRHQLDPIVVLLRIDYIDGQSSLMEMTVGQFRKLDWIDEEMPLKAVTYAQGSNRHRILDAILKNSGTVQDVDQDEFVGLQEDLVRDLLHRGVYFQVPNEFGDERAVK